MKARRRLGHATGPQGGCLELFEHDGAYTILWDGQILMDSRTHTSEYQMGHLGLVRCEPGSAPRILIGGLGLGYTLKGVLEKASAQAVVEVVECVDTLVDWNHRFCETSMVIYSKTSECPSPLGMSVSICGKWTGGPTM